MNSKHLDIMTVNICE